ncbi:MAG: FKBP-type peptidyl-prolyl cis-trans isomerase [Bacteroidales bacterium]|nr:FKBP-type peptidyl-prolyl cis-trans isomerase [Bacteroidales bacterium]
MSKKSDYRQRNEDFLNDLRGQEGVGELPCGVLYRVVNASGGDRHPNIRSVVSVHYTGTLINGRIFDDTRRTKTPAAFRLKDVITGWQIALARMSVGDRWQIYIPAQAGYGERSVGAIPGNSTLIFDVELLSIA